MSQISFHVRPQWPTSLEAYEYLRTAAMPEWAWEFLRRNPVVALGLTLPQLASLASILIGAALLVRIRSTGTEWTAPESVAST